MPATNCSLDFWHCSAGQDSQPSLSADAASVLDPLNGSDYQCHHGPGEHAKLAGGRDADGSWLSHVESAYPPQFVVRLAMAFTAARTGSAQPLARPTAAPPPEASPSQDADSAPDAFVPPPPPDVTPPQPSPPVVPPSAAAAPNSTPVGAPSPVAFRGFAPGTNASAAAAPPTPASARAPSVNLGPGIVSRPAERPRQRRVDRSVRSSTRGGASRDAQFQQALDREAARLDRLRAAREAREQPQPAPSPSTHPSPLESIAESPSPSPSSYVPFTGSTPPPSFPSDALDDMEATVAGLVADAYGSSPPIDLEPLSDWMELSSLIAPSAAAVSVGDGTWVEEVKQEQLMALLMSGQLSAKQHHLAFHVLTALRADSIGAPETYNEAVARGPAWVKAIGKELDNHDKNGSWSKILRSSVPRGRRIHKMVWVFKEKRDGTCKARLCVQGCTLVGEGVDYDQTFSAALRHPTARCLFAFAARRGCRVRSIDYVAAYLQGEFVEGESIFCHLPRGAEVNGSDGKPMVCEIKKPIYGIPQAGRRLQRVVFPWMTDTMRLRQLDDSDGCCFVYDDPDGKETFVVGIYVDNLQIVHSAELDSNGDAVDPNSFYARFVKQLRADWDVVDEGPMDDLLGLEVRREADGALVLHQKKYIEKAVERFYPDGLPNNKGTLPYSEDIQQIVIDALDGPPATSPAYPELVRPCQQRVGTLMYVCTGCRPDVCYAVNMYCRAMARPTPALMAEMDHTFCYLARTADLGLRFEPGPSDMCGYGDASWEMRNSTSGWCIMWQNAAVVWGSRKQQCIALSSCEAEIVALSEAAKDVVYFRKLLSGLDPSAVSGPSNLYSDSKSARDLAYNPEHHNKTKHIERRHFYIRDMVEKFEMRVPFVVSANNYADFFTKPMKLKSFVALRNKIMNVAPDVA